MMRRRERGFTLAELVMVAALIAILSSMVLPVVQPAPASARASPCMRDRSRRKPWICVVSSTTIC